MAFANNAVTVLRQVNAFLNSTVDSSFPNGFDLIVWRFFFFCFVSLVLLFYRARRGPGDDNRTLRTIRIYAYTCRIHQLRSKRIVVRLFGIEIGFVVSNAVTVTYTTACRE